MERACVCDHNVNAAGLCEGGAAWRTGQRKSKEMSQRQVSAAGQGAQGSVLDVHFPGLSLRNPDEREARPSVTAEVNGATQITQLPPVTG